MDKRPVSFTKIGRFFVLSFFALISILLYLLLFWNVFNLQIIKESC